MCTGTVMQQQDRRTLEIERFTERKIDYRFRFLFVIDCMHSDVFAIKEQTGGRSRKETRVPKE
jgi:hypothetical protein